MAQLHYQIEPKNMYVQQVYSEVLWGFFWPEIKKLKSYKLRQNILYFLYQ